VRQAFLVIERGGFPGAEFNVTAEETLIGRNPNTDITLVDEGVSREHAVVIWEDGACSIEDLQSTNGTKVNGKRVRSQPLQDGDRIQIGGTVFRFCLRRAGGAPAGKPATQIES
jgi:pSer/pThr/pTyr-binding forkhead associated (FHA) protein